MPPILTEKWSRHFISNNAINRLFLEHWIIYLSCHSKLLTPALWCLEAAPREYQVALCTSVLFCWVFFQVFEVVQQKVQRSTQRHLIFSWCSVYAPQSRITQIFYSATFFNLFTYVSSGFFYCILRRASLLNIRNYLLCICGKQTRNLHWRVKFECTLVELTCFSRNVNQLFSVYGFAFFFCVLDVILSPDVVLKIYALNDTFPNFLRWSVGIWYFLLDKTGRLFGVEWDTPHCAHRRRVHESNSNWYYIPFRNNFIPFEWTWNCHFGIFWRVWAALTVIISFLLLRFISSIFRLTSFDSIIIDVS